MNRWPIRAEVCLEAEKTASRRETKKGNRGTTGRKDETIRSQGETRQESGVFPQPVKPIDFIYLLGTAEAVSFQKGSNVEFFRGL